MRALLLALVLLAPLALAAGERVESRSYVGPTHATSARFTSCSVPDAAPALNGACFRLRGDETSVSVEVADASALSILAHVFFERPHAPVNDHAYDCTGSVTLAVPPGATLLRVWFPPLDGVEAAPVCPPVHGAATTGTVVARFS